MKRHCALCDGDCHPTNYCTVISPEDRLKTVVNKMVCYNCFGNHAVANCQSRFRCCVCGRKHHTSLHTSIVEGTNTAAMATTISMNTKTTANKSYSKSNLHLLIKEHSMPSFSPSLQRRLIWKRSIESFSPFKESDRETKNLNGTTSFNFLSSKSTITEWQSRQTSSKTSLLLSKIRTATSSSSYRI